MISIENLNRRFGYATAKLAEASENGDAYDCIYWRGYKDCASALMEEDEQDENR